MTACKRDGSVRDDNPIVEVIQAVIAFALSRLVFAGLVAMMANDGFDLVVRGACAISDAAFRAQQSVELCRMREEANPSSQIADDACP